MKTKIQGQAARAGDRRAVHSVQLPTEIVRTSGEVTTMSDLTQSDLQGTVPANVEIADDWTYGMLSDNWIRGAPLGPVARAASSPTRLRAKDLIAELDSINAQIHRIMFQVEKAVARLATSG
jgi:hypothetical protein